MKFMQRFHTLTKNGVFKPKHHTDPAKLLSSYRYSSLILTASFYFLDGTPATVVYKLAAVLGLYIMARIINDLYVRYLAYPQLLGSVILLETLLITLLLIPTGGLESPFIWYALNPVLVAAWYMSNYFCWFNLALYIITSLSISTHIFKGKALELITTHSYLILVLILITLLVRLLSTFMKHLQTLNLKNQESLEHVMSLYQIIEAFNNEDDLEMFFQTLTDYAAKLAKVELSFFWREAGERDFPLLYTNLELSSELKEQLTQQIELTSPKLLLSTAHRFNLDNQNFYVVGVKSTTKFYGLLGIKIQEQNQETQALFERDLGFLADVSSIVLERFALQETNERLNLLEERDRIANEIHDSVCQRIFSIRGALYWLKTNWHHQREQEINDQFEVLNNSAKIAMLELRQSIYSLSSQKNGEKILFSSIKSYLKDLAYLNRIDIQIDLIGDEEVLSARLKKAIYRIICEATGNALKHGKGKVISVGLKVEGQGIELSVADNGTGFAPQILDQESSGLGLVNMKNLVKSFGGSFSLTSQEHRGTQINIRIPHSIRSEQGQGGIA